MIDGKVLLVANECCLGYWLGTDEALVLWSTAVDTLNNPLAPYVGAPIWIPPNVSGSKVTSAPPRTPAQAN